MTHSRLVGLGILSLFCFACPPPPTASDAGPVDSGTRDSGNTDSGVADAGTVDAGAIDSGAVDSGSLDSGTPSDAGGVGTDAGNLDAGMDAGGLLPDGGPFGCPAPDGGVCLEGPFATAVNYPTGYTYGAAIADFNGDGVPDVAVCQNGAASVAIFFGSCAGTLTFQATYPTGIDPAPIVAADFDGDGKPDLALASGDGLDLLLNQGDGTFAPKAVFPGGGGWGLAVADFDGDGRPDVAASAGPAVTNAQVVVSFNDGGTFGPPQSFPAGNSIWGIVAGDLNGDGMPDVAVASDNGSVNVLLNQGGGTLGSPASYASGIYKSVPLGLADFNGDGSPDLVVATDNCNETHVGVLLNSGAGTFGAPSLFAAGNCPTIVATGDFDSNGLPDIVVSNFSNNTVSVLLNGGNGGFSAPAAYAVGGEPTGIAVGDLRQNGLSDLVVPVYPQKVSVLLGTCR